MTPWLPLGNELIGLTFRIDRLSISLVFFVSCLFLLTHLFAMGWLERKKESASLFLKMHSYTFFANFALLSDNLITFYLALEGLGILLLLYGTRKNWREEGQHQKIPAFFFWQRVAAMSVLASIFLAHIYLGTLHFHSYYQFQPEAINDLAPQYASTSFHKELNSLNGQVFSDPEAFDSYLHSRLERNAYKEIKPYQQEILSQVKQEGLNQKIMDITKNQKFHIALFSMGFLLLFASFINTWQFPFHRVQKHLLSLPLPFSVFFQTTFGFCAGFLPILRFHTLFANDSIFQEWMIGIGFFTALLMGIRALRANSILQILIFSTISQFGFLWIMLGVSANNIVLFHGIVHGFAKTLLYFNIGWILYKSGSKDDLRSLGNLKETFPLSWLSCVISAAALTLLPLGTGWFSSVQMLYTLWFYNDSFHLLWFAGLVIQYLTLFYLFRLVTKVFLSQPSHPKKTPGHWEQPPAFTFSSILILTTIIGLLGVIEIPVLFQRLFDVTNAMSVLRKETVESISIQQESLGIGFTITIIPIFISLLLMWSTKKIYLSPILLMEKFKKWEVIVGTSITRWMDRIRYQFHSFPVRFISTISFSGYRSWYEIGISYFSSGIRRNRITSFPVFLSFLLITVILFLSFLV